jgi:hypothetical protein
MVFFKVEGTVNSMEQKTRESFVKLMSKNSISGRCSLPERPVTPRPAPATSPAAMKANMAAAYGVRSVAGGVMQQPDMMRGMQQVEFFAFCFLYPEN